MAKSEIVKLRQLYPQLPRNISRLLIEAARGKDQFDKNPRMEQVFERLDVAVGRDGFMNEGADWLDPWHRSSVVSIMTTRHRLGDRERLAIRTIKALDTIKAQAQPGTPFLSSRSRNFIAGRLGAAAETVDFKMYPAPQLRLKGLSVNPVPDSKFPDFKVEREASYSFPLRPENTSDKLYWQPTYEIGEGRSKLLSLGPAQIRSQVRRHDPESSFYAALALELAGVNPGVKARPAAASRAGEVLVASMANALGGITTVSPATQVRGAFHHDHYHPQSRQNRLDDMSLDVTRAYLNVVGLDADGLSKELNSRLRFMAGGERATVRTLAGAVSGQMAVGNFVEQLFNSEML